MDIVDKLLKEGVKKRITIVFRNQVRYVTLSEDCFNMAGYEHVLFGKDDIPGGLLRCRVIASNNGEDKSVIVEPDPRHYHFPSNFIFIKGDAILNYYPF